MLGVQLCLFLFIVRDVVDKQEGRRTQRKKNLHNNNIINIRSLDVGDDDKIIIIMIMENFFGR